MDRTLAPSVSLSLPFGGKDANFSEASILEVQIENSCSKFGEFYVNELLVPHLQVPK